MTNFHSKNEKMSQLTYKLSNITWTDLYLKKCKLDNFYKLKYNGDTKIVRQEHLLCMKF